MAAQRDVARALIFGDENRLLMLHWRDPLTGHEFLEPPGGARAPSETFQEALQREIAEETGITEIEVGSLVSEIDHAFTFAGEHYDCRERFFVCRALGSERGQRSLDPIEESGIIGVEWWALEDLVTQPQERLEPPQLLEMLREVREIPPGG